MRLYLIVEGQTEETFVNTILAPHLRNFAIQATVNCVQTGRRRGVVYRGGVTSYAKMKHYLIRRMGGDTNADVRFTTMFDLYKLPTDFPNQAEAAQTRNPYCRIKRLEDGFGRDISDNRFIPYLQLHEFEALLLSEPEKFDAHYLNHGAAIQRLVDMASKFDSPEHIDDGAETAPSKRIIAEIPEYDRQKTSAAPLIATRIGLDSMRSKCPHFDEWVRKLENLE